MLELHVTAPDQRQRAGVARLREGLRLLASGSAAASASTLLASQHGNATCDPLRPWGHPPFGRYRLAHHAPAPPELRDEYGDTLFLFRAVSGPALEAESFGRLALLVYGGPKGGDGRLRRTQGGLRVGTELAAVILERLRDGSELALEIERVQPRPWWAFWRSDPTLDSLSQSAVKTLPAGGDEASLIETLSRATPRPVSRPSGTRETERDRDHDWRDTDRHSSSSEPSPFRGGGGEFAGGGASGRWDGPAPGPGVDQAGRIVAGAAMAAGVAGLAAAAMQGDSKTHTGATADGGGDSPEPSETASASASDTHTTTSTTY